MNFPFLFIFFFFNDTATTEIYTLSLHDALPICRRVLSSRRLLRRGAAEPLLETRRGEARVIAGDKALIVQLCAEVAGVDVRGHLPWVSRCAQETPGQFIHSDWFGTRNLDRTL